MTDQTKTVSPEADKDVSPEAGKDRVVIFDTTLRDGEQAPTMRMQASPRARMRLTGGGLSCSLRGNSTGQDAP